MRIKKVLQGTALTALAAAAWMGAATVDASASTITTSDIEIWDNVMYVNASSDTAEILFGVGTYKSSATKDNTVKISAWDVYDGNSAQIDLSKLNNTKDVYVAVKTESSAPIYIKFAAAPKSQKLNYDAEKNTLTIDSIKAGTETNLAATGYNWQYRTSNGSWSPLYGEDSNDVDECGGSKYAPATTLFSEYQAQGASLYVRAAATSSALTVDTASGKIKDAAKNTDSDPSYDVYKAGSLPGKETKLNIAKQANGPSVTADYVNKTVKVKKDTEYRVWTADDSDKYSLAITTTKASDNGDTLNVADTLLKGASSGVIEVRTVAKSANANGKGSKVASKWTRVELKKTGKIALKNNVSIATTAAVVDADGRIEINKDVKNDKFTKNIIVKVSTGSSITVKVGTKKAVTVKGDDKGKKIKADINDTINIAIAGDKKNKVWAGDDTLVGTLK